LIYKVCFLGLDIYLQLGCMPRTRTLPVGSPWQSDLSCALDMGRELSRLHSLNGAEANSMSSLIIVCMFLIVMNKCFYLCMCDYTGHWLIVISMNGWCDNLSLKHLFVLYHHRAWTRLTSVITLYWTRLPRCLSSSNMIIAHGPIGFGHSTSKVWRLHVKSISKAKHYCAIASSRTRSSVATAVTGDTVSTEETMIWSH